MITSSTLFRRRAKAVAKISLSSTAAWPLLRSADLVSHLSVSGFAGMANPNRSPVWLGTLDSLSQFVPWHRIAAGGTVSVSGVFDPSALYVLADECDGVTALVTGASGSAVPVCAANAIQRNAPKLTASTGTPGWGLSTHTSRHFFQYGNHWRVRVTGPIQKVRLYFGATEHIDSLTVSTWRRNGSYYDRVDVTGNLISLVTANSLQTITLPQTLKARRGDFIGYQLIGDGSHAAASMVSRADAGGVQAYYIPNADPGTTAFNWLAQTTTAAGYDVPIELHGANPVFATLGDSLMAGHPLNNSYLETAILDSETSWLGSYLETRYGLPAVNLGIGSQTSVQIAARCAADLVGSGARIAILNGGTNDLGLGVLEADFLSSWETILDLCESNGILPIVLPIFPRTTGSASLHRNRATWNADLVTLCADYDAIVCDCETLLGQFREGGDDGNLWDIKTEYNADDIHLNAAGYAAVAGKVGDDLDAYLVAQGACL